MIKVKNSSSIRTFNLKVCKQIHLKEFIILAFRKLINVELVNSYNMQIYFIKI